MTLIDREKLIEDIFDHVVSMSVCTSTEERNGMIRMREAIMDDIYNSEVVDAKPIIRCGECAFMLPNGECAAFADSCIRPSVSDFCSYGKKSPSKED